MMFGNVNQCNIIGNITKDLEPKVTASGAQVVSFGLAVNRSFKKEDNWESETTFVDVVLWGNRADTLCKYAKKGTKVYVSGRLSTRSWADNEGKKHYKTEIVAEDVQILERSNSDSSETEVINPEDLPF